MVADFEANGANKNNKEILTLFAENVGATTDSLVASCGITFEEGLHQLGEYSHNRELAYTGGGAGFAEADAQGCGGSRCSGAAEYQGRVPDRRQRHCDRCEGCLFRC